MLIPPVLPSRIAALYRHFLARYSRDKHEAKTSSYFPETPIYIGERDTLGTTGGCRGWAKSAMLVQRKREGKNAAASKREETRA